MKTVYFDCPRKGRVLTLIFDNFDEITADNLEFLKDSKSDRYVRILVEIGGLTVYSMMIKFELGNAAIIAETVEILKNDLSDLTAISQSK